MESRRALLRRIGQTGVVAAGAGTASAQDARLSAVIPEVDEYEGNYVGQWLEINEQTNANGEPVDACDRIEWSANDAQGYTGFLMDRRTGEQPIVELTVLTQAGTEGPEDDTTFIVDEATECGNGFVSLGLSEAPRRSVVGEPSGPSADGGGGGGDGGGEDGGGIGDSIPGFGVGVGALALVAGALARAFGREER